MPTFDTPRPILVDLELGVGEVRIIAGNVTDTTVEVRPTDPSKTSDVTAAEQTRVEYSDGRLVIRAPKSWRRYTTRGGGESVDVRIEIPSGSRLRGDAGVAGLHVNGSLGGCEYKTGVGDIQIDQAGPVHLSAGVGDIAVQRASQRVEITTGSGSVRLGSVDGTAVVKGANGDTWVGTISGDLRVASANGSIVVDHSDAGVVAKTTNGDVRLNDIGGGSVVAHTALGKVEIGIRKGVAAWLDLNTTFGKVHNDLDATGRPDPGAPSTDVHARSSFGDITVHRAGATTAVGSGV
jgi:putative adhesin